MYQNYMNTEFFSVKSRVKQCNPLSPFLVSLFINDLTKDINGKQCGVKFEFVEIGILLCADDMVLLI